MITMLLAIISLTDLYLLINLKSNKYLPTIFNLANFRYTPISLAPQTQLKFVLLWPLSTVSSRLTSRSNNRYHYTNQSPRLRSSLNNYPSKRNFKSYFTKPTLWKQFFLSYRKFINSRKKNARSKEMLIIFFNSEYPGDVVFPIHFCRYIYMVVPVG
jgi:hypothetical protein